MSIPLGEKTLATRRPCRSRSTTSQRTLTPAMSASRAANDIVPHTICWPRHENVWSSSGASMPCSLTSCPATTMVSPSMTLAGPVSESVRRLNVKMATRRPSIRLPYAAIPYRRRSIRRVGLPLRVLRRIRGSLGMHRAAGPKEVDMIEVRRTNDGILSSSRSWSAKGTVRPLHQEPSRRGVHHAARSVAATVKWLAGFSRQRDGEW